VLISASLDKCQGYANCVVEAEDFFDIDDTGKVVLLQPEVTRASDFNVVEAGVRSCPVAALSLSH
jgi:ferredoxin